MPVIIFIYKCSNKVCKNTTKHALMKREPVVCGKCGSSMELVGIEKK